MTLQRIAVVGAGAWGTALAHLVARAGRDVILWGRDLSVIAAVTRTRENPRYQSGLSIDPAVLATANIKELQHAETVLLAVPAQEVRVVARQITDAELPAVPVLCCAKGLEVSTGLLMSEVLEEELPDRHIGCLSGPTFAGEAMRGMPTAVTLAMADRGLGGELARSLGTTTFRPYLSGDVIAAEVGGAVKNVLAIACGIANGLGFGENTRATLITRGLAEMSRFAEALGGRAESMAGLAGLGDLAMTCGSHQSRNFQFGEALGQGRALAAVLAAAGGVIEGRHTAEAVTTRAQTLDVELPICGAVDHVLNRDGNLRVAIERLMNRPLRAEIDG